MAEPPRGRLLLLVLGIVAGTAVIAVGATGAGYYIRDREPRPAAQTVTASPAAKAPAGPDGADGLFLSTLATFGVSDNGFVTRRQRLMEFGHHACFSLLPPRPQSRDSAINGLVAAEAQDVDWGSPGALAFTHEDAEHLVQAAIGAYCPDVPK